MRFVTFSILLLFSLPATAADNGCLEHDPVIDQTDVWNFQAPARTDFYLPTSNDWGHYQTPAAAHIEWDDRISVSFDYVQPDQFGLFYTVHRMLIQIGEETDEERVVIDLDYTHGCVDTGISFAPGRVIKEAPIKFPARSDGLPRGSEPIRIRVWGHL